MPHITLPVDLPGMAGLHTFKPATAATLKAFTQQLLRGPSSLSVAERETIAAHVSTRNECQFCTSTHTAVAAHVTGTWCARPSPSLRRRRSATGCERCSR